jgi:hypothetical protein
VLLRVLVEMGVGLREPLQQQIHLLASLVL